jgi:hypothetical protein
LIAYAEQLHLDHRLIGNETRFPELIKEFSMQADKFLFKWADAKGDFPLGVEDYLRAIRHNCRHLIQRVSGLSADLVTDKLITSANLEMFTDGMRSILRLVDSYTYAISDVRHALLDSHFSASTFPSVRARPPIRKVTVVEFRRARRTIQSNFLISTLR